MARPSHPIGASVLVGVLCALVLAPIANLSLRGYVVLTVSVGPTHQLARLITAATVVVGITSFCAGTITYYVGQKRAPP